MSQSITMLVGPSASGKTTLAKKMVDWEQGVRVNRDTLRDMLFNGKWDQYKERLIRDVEQSIAKTALDFGYNVIVDDTNISKSARQMWEGFASDADAVLLPHSVDASLKECIQRDALRTGKAQVGRAVIERQFLKAGLAALEYDERPVVIVDIDGTLAYNDGHRSFYDEGEVLWDKAYPVVVRWVRELAKDHQIVIFSGRHATCCTDTVAWLKLFSVPFDHILMRNGGDNRPDEIVKKELLDDLLLAIPKSQIKMVLDDRPKVVNMWKENGLFTIPVRGDIEDF